MTWALPLALSDAVRDWLDLGLRWLHVIAAMAWIGTSFYFVLLDQSLRAPKEAADAEAGVGGELWEVHGGGFYHVQKYVVAPRVLPEHLAWFKWEAYTTWLSGFGLMLVLYYLEASSALVKPGDDLDPWIAVAVSIGLLAAGWIVYDVLNRLVSDHSRAVAGALPARGTRRVGLVRALQPAGRVAPGRGDDRDGDGRKRLLRHHPGAARARPREGGGSRARPWLRASRRSSARSRTTTSRCLFC